MAKNLILETRSERIVLPLIVLLLMAAPAGADCFNTGTFGDGAPWFTSPLGFGVEKPTSSSDPLPVDRDGDGDPDADYNLPTELWPDTGIDFEYRLSPSQDTLYVTKFNTDTGGLTTVCGGYPNVEIHLYDLGSWPNPTPFTLVGAGGSRCVTGPLARQPSFFDQSGEVRTMVLVGESFSAAIPHEVLWADLISQQYTIDSSTYQYGIGPSTIQFSPSGNVAFITHGNYTAQKKYTFIDLCDDPLGGTATTLDLPSSGWPTAQIIQSGSDYLAELLLNGIPQPNPTTLSTACCPTGSIACCQPGVGCTDGLTSSQCIGAGGAVLDGTCATVECEESCCFEGGCIVTPADDCAAAGGDPQGTFSCDGVYCPQPYQACCTLQGNCVDATFIECTDVYNGIPQGEGTECWGSPPITCPMLNLTISKSGPTQVRERDPFTYTIDYENDGDLDAPSTLIQDNLSWQLEFISASHGGQENSGQVEWALGDVTPGQSGQVTLSVRSGCDANWVDNSAIASTSGLQFWSNTAQTEIIPDIEPIGITIGTAPENGLPVEGGDLITYTFTLTNTISELRRDVRFNIDVEPGLTLESVVDDGGGVVTVTSSESWLWTGDVEASLSVDVAVTARVDSCIQTNEVELKKVVVESDCGSDLGVAPHTVLEARRAVEVEFSAINLNPPGTLETYSYTQTYQLLRHGDTLDLQLTATNPHSTTIPAASMAANLPYGYDAVGNPPFIAPTEPGATWNAGTERVEWTGSLAPGQTATITFRVLHLGGNGSPYLNGNGSDGTCSIYVGHNLTPIPYPPSSPYLLALGEGELMTFRPGVDTEPQELFEFNNDYVVWERIARAQSGDIWVAGPPVFRFNPDTLELEGFPLEFVDDLGFIPDGLAVDIRDGTLIFLGNKWDEDDYFLGMGIRRYDPVSGTLTALLDSTPDQRPSVDRLDHDNMMVDPWGGIAFENADILFRFTGSPDPAELTDNLHFNFLGIALDEDGSYLNVSMTGGPTQQILEDILPGSGDATFIADLEDHLPDSFWGGSMAAGDQGDIYIASEMDGLAVVHRQPTLSVEELLPDTSTGDALRDIVWVSDACVDNDGDGAGVGAGCAASNVDCDDTNEDVFPGAPEINDGIDNQCPGDHGSGTVDELSPTSYFAGSGAGAQFHWATQSGATEYEGVRSPSRDFSAGCTSHVTTETHWNDLAAPASGETLHYLARPFAPVPGSFGKKSDGDERAISCP